MGAVALGIAACDRSASPPAASSPDPEAPTSTSTQTEAPTEATPEEQPVAAAAKKKQLPVALTWEPGKAIPECALEDADWEQRKKWSKEDQEACWRKKGIWPYAPALTEQEWRELVVTELSLPEIRLLRGRAVTGDICAALASDESDTMKRWSPALWAEGNMAIWVVKGENALAKAKHVYGSLGGEMGAGQGVLDCGKSVVIYSTGSSSGLYKVASLLLDEGLELLEHTAFAVSSPEEIVEKCLADEFWAPRCALLMQMNMLSCAAGDRQPSQPVCVGSKKFLERYHARDPR